MFRNRAHNHIPGTLANLLRVFVLLLLIGGGQSACCANRPLPSAVPATPGSLGHSLAPHLLTPPKSARQKHSGSFHAFTGHHITAHHVTVHHRSIASRLRRALHSADSLPQASLDAVLLFASQPEEMVSAAYAEYSLPVRLRSHRGRAPPIYL